MAIRSLLGICCAWSAAACARGYEADPAEVRFELVNNRIRVPVAVNGSGPYEFLFDTGASGIGRLDVSLRDRLGIPVTGQAENFDGVNTSSIDVVTVEQLALGPLVRRDVDLLSRDYGLDGILGLGFFEQELLTIDYPNRVLRIAGGSLGAGEPHVTDYGEFFELPVTLGRIETTAHLDTGSSLAMHLPMSYADRLETTELIEAGIGRRAYTEFQLYRATILEPVEIAGNRLTALEVVFSEEALGINIGSALLQQFAITIDQGNGRLRIERSGAVDGS